MFGRRGDRHWLVVLISAVLLALGLAVAPTASAQGTASHQVSAPRLYHEPYRPQFHFTPAKNWMNDPNGPIYYKGRYHLFYQYNPSGTTWGNISWGHAVSTDLVHWKELPIAIPQDDNEYIFSGSVVYDRKNTSGLGTAANPPLVAVYTASLKSNGIQEQSLASSTDGGLTWTKYANNPVLNLDSTNFRDPKVFWYPKTRTWEMVVALSDQHKVSIYSSPDLKTWTHQSDFGPAGATGGVWECPNLFPLKVKGTDETKWVLVVGINPGGIAGGSGDQYFVGSFDGTTFTSNDPATYTPPPGTTYAGFDCTSYAPWTDHRDGVRQRTGNRATARTVGRGRRRRNRVRGQLQRRRRVHRHPVLTGIHRGQALPQLQDRRWQPPPRPGFGGADHAPRRHHVRRLRRTDLRRRLDRDRRPGRYRPGNWGDRWPASGQRLPRQATGQHFLRRRYDHRNDRFADVHHLQRLHRHARRRWRPPLHRCDIPARGRSHRSQPDRRRQGCGHRDRREQRGAELAVVGRLRTAR